MRVLHDCGEQGDNSVQRSKKLRDEPEGARAIRYRWMTFHGGGLCHREQRVRGRPSA
jgi:hypothetical protein